VKQALVDLSQLGGVEYINLGDLIGLLPDPSTSLADFLHQSVGLVLILDQGPRYSCKGVNARYIYEYFDLISREFLDYLVDLPEQQNPFRFQTWKSAGVPLDHAWLRLSMLLAPIVHSEALSDMDLQMQMTDHLRQYYEEATQVKDPYRESFGTDLEDEYLLSKLLETGPPRGMEWI
jgi:hypothetical protein